MASCFGKASDLGMLVYQVRVKNYTELFLKCVPVAEAQPPVPSILDMAARRGSDSEQEVRGQCHLFWPPVSG